MTSPFDPLPSDRDPVRRAQVLMRAELPKRFYASAAVGSHAEGFVVELDGRPARTPAKAIAAVPDRRIAEVLAAEWQAQETHVDPRTMPMLRLVNSAIDGVARAQEAVRAGIVGVAEADLLFYRPEGPAGLVARTSAQWDPILRWAEGRLATRFVLAEGVMPVAQSPEALAAVAAAVPEGPPLLLAALHQLATLTGSTLIALAVAEGAITLETGWAAANLDEDWTSELWGVDAEAAERRRAQEEEARIAALVLECLIPKPEQE